MGSLRRGRSTNALLQSSLIVTGILLISLNVSGMDTSDAKYNGDPSSIIMTDATWTDMTPSNPPPGRLLCSFVYDPPTDTHILFGGMDYDFNMLNDTWSYDLGTNTWEELFPVDQPSVSLGSAYSYDDVDGIMLLFGTFDDSFMPANETWSYNASTNVWTLLTTTNAPSFRNNGCAAYDSQSDKMIMFGGDGMDGQLNDTWSFDFTSKAWTELSPTYSPSPRYGAAMVYDSDSDRIVLFGGFYQDEMGSDETFFADTWAYDFESNTWRNMAPFMNPLERAFSSAVYDPFFDVMLIFGGASITDAYGDLWAYDYDANLWSEANQPTAPQARAYGSMAINPATGEVVLFSGADPMGVMNDTWSMTQGATIPEFSAIIVPIVGMLALFAAVGSRHRRNGAP